MQWGLDARGYLASRLEDRGRTVSSDDTAAVPAEFRGDRLGAGLTIARTRSRVSRWPVVCDDREPNEQVEKCNNTAGVRIGSWVAQV